MDYGNYRAYASHDLHHVLTGFNFDQSGELGDFSLSVGQYTHPGFAMISLVSFFLHWIVAEKPHRQLHEDYGRIRAASYKLDLIHQGVAMGAAARALFALDMPALLKRNLEDLRAELHLVPCAKGWPAGIHGLVCWGPGLITILNWLQD
ncbi:MAG: hypothetical protein NTY67_12125 [Cyanobacteria bacterium]|nr:hypothetical protein [Cyanobacteriota bacterium]